MTEPTRTEKIRFFINEFLLKDWDNALGFLWGRLVFWWNPHVAGINPDPTAQKADQIAILLIPGSDGNPSGFLNLARALEKEKIGPVYTVSFKQTDDDLIPATSTVEMINKIGNCILVGHSLGGVIALKAAQQNENVVGIVTLGSRIKYQPCSTSWFCQGMEEVINGVYEAFTRYIPLIPIWGKDDGLVPRESALPEKATLTMSVEGASHIGILYRPLAVDTTILAIQTILASQQSRQSCDHVFEGSG